MCTLAFEPEFHLILNLGEGRKACKNFPSLTSKDQTRLPFLSVQSPFPSVQSPSPDQLYSIIFLARSSAPLALLVLGADTDFLVIPLALFI